MKISKPKIWSKLTKKWKSYSLIFFEEFKKKGNRNECLDDTRMCGLFSKWMNLNRKSPWIPRLKNFQALKFAL